MKTVEEASKLWCPHVRFVCSNGQVDGNRIVDSSLDAHTNCIGDGCMSWRWCHDYETKNKNAYDNAYTTQYRKVTVDEKGDREIAEKLADEAGKAAMREPKGYCGLAGKP